jgi:hypothetical protein
MPTTVDLCQEAGQEKRGDSPPTSERRRLAELRQGGLSMEQLRAVALLKRRLAVNYLWEARRLKMVQLELRGSVEKKGGGRSEHHRWRKGERRKGRAGLLTGGEGSLEKGGRVVRGCSLEERGLHSHLSGWSGGEESGRGGDSAVDGSN